MLLQPVCHLDDFLSTERRALQAFTFRSSGPVAPLTPCSLARPGRRSAPQDPEIRELGQLILSGSARPSLLRPMASLFHREPASGVG